MRLFRSACLLALLGTPHSAYSQEGWRLTPEDASCLQENLTSYEASTDEPVVIFLRVCPVVDRAEALRQLQQNDAGLPAGPSVVVAPDGAPFDEVIVYSRSELTCLRTILSTAEGSPIILPQSPCPP